jgi:hypothetical protein
MTKIKGQGANVDSASGVLAITDMSETAAKLSRPRIAPNAREIGDLFRNAKSSYVESVRYLIQTGHKLKSKKESLSRGQWIPWLEENERALGFGTRTAQRLIKLSKYDVNDTFDGLEEALQISREIWGNQATALVSKSTTNNEEQPEEHEQEDEENTRAENEQPDEDREEDETTEDEPQPEDEHEDEKGSRGPKLSRPQQWHKAVADATAAVERLIDLQSEYQMWRDNLPDNLANSPVAEKLDETCDLDFEDVLQKLREAEAIDLPCGFGLD